MSRYKILFLVVFIPIVTIPSILSAAQEVSEVQKYSWKSIVSEVMGQYPLPPDATDIEKPKERGKLSIPKNWEFDLAARRYLISHNSYEYGSHVPPYTNPLSRLEFPMNTWWLDFTIRRTCPRWSVGSDLAFSISRYSDGVMKDTDWESEGNQNLLAIYSEGDLRVDKGFKCRSDIDVNVSDWLNLPKWLEIRPLFAFQYQRVDTMTYGGTQWWYRDVDLDDENGTDDEEDHDMRATPSNTLSGDCIRFKQDWYLYQIGVRAVCDLPKPTKYMELKLHGEADWGPAYGYNEDFHLQRRGNLISHIASRGNSLYFLVGMDMEISKTIKIGTDIDYTWIRTSGVIRDENHPLNSDYTSSYGVNVWSDQLSLMMHISYEF